jgi:hypothetical protein
MRLYEISSPRLYHGSRKEFPIGFVLTPQAEGYAHGSGMDTIELEAHQYCETKLEDYRPRAAISRKNAVYMVAKPDEVDRAGGYEDFTYLVEPIGSVWRCNLYWYSMLESLGHDIENADENYVRSMAQAYWSATPNDLGEPHRDLIEYLVTSAKIIEIID